MKDPLSTEKELSDHRMSQSKPFEVGDLLRYNSGPSALFRVHTVYLGYAGSVARYYGQHCLGGVEGRYHEQCQRASEADHQAWDALAHWRDTDERPAVEGDF